MGYVMRRFLRSVMVVFSWFVIPYSRLATIRIPRRKLPPMKNPLLEIPAVDLAEMIRTRQVSVTYVCIYECYLFNHIRVYLKTSFCLGSFIWFTWFV